ncbi:putative Histidine kinase [Nitrospira sp. KM1]|nr:putative Histidine kinase [Nitrospira sp. KM1]
MRLFNAIVASTLLSAVLLVALALIAVKFVDRMIIEEAAARHRHAEFLLIASVVSKAINEPVQIANSERMKPILEEIQQLRAGIRGLEIFQLTPHGPRSLVKTGADLGGFISQEEIESIRSNNLVAHFDDSDTDRAWILTAPIRSNGTIIGALHGRFSVSKYDSLIKSQETIAKLVAVGAVLITSLTMLLLVRVHLHRPLARLLNVMEQVRAGRVDLQAAVTGPWEVRHLAANFNQMMAQLRTVISERENLLHEIQSLNASLEHKVYEAVQQLDKERDSVAEAKLAAQRNGNLAALGEVSAIMAHELGNPLNAIYGRLQLIKDRDLPEDSLRHLGVIRTQVSRMTDVIQHILKSTHIDTNPSAIQINEVIREVLGLLQEPGIKIVTELSPHLPLIAANKTVLHGMLLNLVTNAVQAMDHEGQLRLTTSMGEQAPLEGVILVQAMSVSQPMVRITVQDSGIGISQDMLTKICEPFFTTRHDQGGTGLGLAICRRVVATLGGQMTIESLIGQGTTVTVDLPHLPEA